MFRSPVRFSMVAAGLVACLACLSLGSTRAHAWESVTYSYPVSYSYPVTYSASYAYSYPATYAAPQRVIAARPVTVARPVYYHSYYVPTYSVGYAW